jgi:tyrosyl-tRNA synthetase
MKRWWYKHTTEIFCCTGFTVPRDPANGGDTTYSKYEELELAFKKEEVHPGDLKAAVESYINKLLEPIRKKFQDPALKKLTDKAYPSPSKQSKFSLMIGFKCIIRQVSLVFHWSPEVVP